MCIYIPYILYSSLWCRLVWCLARHICLFAAFERTTKRIRRNRFWYFVAIATRVCLSQSSTLCTCVWIAIAIAPHRNRNRNRNRLSDQLPRFELEVRTGNDRLFSVLDVYFRKRAPFRGKCWSVQVSARYHKYLKD